MIDEVITQIVEAEKKADEILAEAHREEKEIGQNGHAEAEQYRAAFSEAAKNETKEILNRTERTAREAEIQRGKEAEAKAAQIERSAEKNVQRTVEWLAELLVKQN